MSEIAGRMSVIVGGYFLAKHFVVSGVLLGGAKLDKYYDNPYFQLKLLFLLLVGVHALVFHRSVYGNAAELDRAPAIPPIAKTAACLSLVLWISILSFGRWIAYY